MKKQLILCFFIPLLSLAQQPSEIEKRLNKALDFEVKEQFKSRYFNGDTLVVVQKFKIDENKLLSYKTKHSMPNGDGYYIRKQEAALKDITSVGKDIYVLLETDNKVKIIDTYFYCDGTKATKTLTETYFRTQFCHQKSNESLGRDLVKLFKKEGFIIYFAFWYD